MANKPLRPCRHPGCSELTASAWCPAHRPKHQRRESAQWHGLYGLPIWKHRLRPQQLAQEPWCAACAGRGLRVRAEVVDHIVPHRGDMARFTDPANLQSLCKRCHDAKTLREQRENGRKTRN